MTAKLSLPQSLSRLRERVAEGRERVDGTRQDKALLKTAKRLRSGQTEAEHKLWHYLRAHRFFGLKFKRQRPIGPYIVDFICLAHYLIIEVDGSQHVDSKEDERRDQWLADHGFKVLRFWNNDVLGNTAEVLEAIRLAIEEPSPPTPLPQAGEGGSKNRKSA